MKRWLVLCLLLFAVLPANALQELHFEGFIADEANLLSKEVKNDLNMTLWDLQKKSGADIAVVTLQTLEGKTVEQTALEIGRTYKIGSKEKNNGLVFLTALSEHKMRIELGYGLENKINMNILQNIRDYDILPYYKKSDYQSGIARGTYLLADIVSQVEGVDIKKQGACPPQISSSSRNSEDRPWWFWPFVIIMSIFGPRRRRFNSGSFGGFGGGGGFGGSGCSGSW